MNEPTKITIHAEQTHTCGQVFETVVYLDMGKTVDLTLYNEPAWPPFEGMDFANLTTFIANQRRMIALTGACSKVEANGMEVTGGRILCQKCKEDLFYLGRSDIENIGSVFPK